MKKNFRLTEIEPNIENLAEDMYNYIYKETNLSIGYVIEENYIEFISWYGSDEKFQLVIDFNEKDLKKIQKQVYNYCKEWINK